MKERKWEEAYEMVSEALIKQVPAKPVWVANDRTDGCPICKEEFYKKVNYCPKCGRKIDWTGKVNPKGAERLTEKVGGCARIKDCGNEMCIETCERAGNCYDCAIAKAVEKLYIYENMEEQGLLLKLPCKVGDTVYFISERTEKQGRRKVVTEFVDKGEADNITVGSAMIPQITVCNDENIWTTFDSVEDFGKTVFLTQAKAEEALKRMEVESD